MQVVPDRLVVAVQTRKEWDAACNRLIDLLRPVARTEGAGIPVTQLASGHYEACLNSNVPPGTTKESWGTCNEPR